MTLRLALVLLALVTGCPKPASSTTASPPSSPIPTTEPAPVVARWACYPTTYSNGEVTSTCYRSMEQCVASQSEALPDLEHGPCTGSDTAICFSGDIVDHEDGSLLLAGAEYCFLGVAECESTREIALADPGSANITACQ